MANEKRESDRECSVPMYLAELMEPRPSNVVKIIAVWDGLSIESQIAILMQLSKVSLPVLEGLPDKLTREIRVKALESKNAYVRYLGATDLYLDENNEEDKKIQKRIESDTDPLLLYSRLEREISFGGLVFDEELKDPAKFWGSPREARLAKVSALSGVGSGSCMAKLVQFAIDTGLSKSKNNQEEIWEVLCEYVLHLRCKDWFKGYRPSYDGYFEYQKWESIEELWKLVPNLPENLSVLLVVFLPTEAGLDRWPSDEITNQMSDLLLQMLLSREDVGLKDFRKKLFLASDKDEGLKSASVSRNFDLKYEEFQEILEKPETEKENVLRLLTDAGDLSLCLYAAIHDLLSLSSREALVGFTGPEFAKISLEQRLSKLEGYQREKQIRELRLYELAKTTVPWGKDETGSLPSGELEFLKQHIVEGDTWRTFMKFSEAWKDQSSRQREEREKNLPRLYEYKIDEYEEVKENDEQPQRKMEIFLTEELARIRNLLSKLQIVLYVVLALLVLVLIFRK